TPRLDDLAGEVGDGEDVGVLLGGQPAHEVQLDLAPPRRVGRGDRADQVLFGDHLVDDPTHPLAAALGCEREPGAASVTGQLVGQLDIEGVDPGGGQREPGVGAFVTVREVLGDLADL